MVRRAAGADLLWATRTRPGICCGVNRISQLIARQPNRGNLPAGLLQADGWKLEFGGAAEGHEAFITPERTLFTSLPGPPSPWPPCLSHRPSLLALPRSAHLPSRHSPAASASLTHTMPIKTLRPRLCCRGPNHEWPRPGPCELIPHRRHLLVLQQQ